MSFQDPFGPFRSDFGPDLIREDPLKWRDVEGRIDTLDVRVRDENRFRRVTDVLLFAAATAVLTFLLFIPTVYLELTSFDSVTIQGKILTGAEFNDKLQSLFFGTSIVALALVSFIASAAIASGQVLVRSRAMGETKGPEGVGKVSPLTAGKIRNV